MHYIVYISAETEQIELNKSNVKCWVALSNAAQTVGK